MRQCSHLYISWHDYHVLIEKLAYQVHASGWAFDQIICIARGGLRPGDILSRLFNKPLGILSTSSYKGEHGAIQGPLDMATHITLAAGPVMGKVLVVDDLADSGVTLERVLARLKGIPTITELRSAVLWVKASSNYKPDYYVELLEHNPWIHQPFEEYDHTPIHELEKKFSVVS